MEEEHWDFSSFIIIAGEGYARYNGKALFSSMIESNAKQVFLNENHYSSMILDIVEVRFNRLKILGLS